MKNKELLKMLSINNKLVIDNLVNEFFNLTSEESRKINLELEDKLKEVNNLIKDYLNSK